jgi:hypothetical protein
MNNVPDRVFVLYDNKSPAMPCFRGRAWHLLKAGRAAVYRLVPRLYAGPAVVRCNALRCASRLHPNAACTGSATGYAPSWRFVGDANSTFIPRAKAWHRGYMAERDAAHPFLL